jgi:hypothetical protein
MSGKSSLENFVCKHCQKGYPEVEPYFQRKGSVEYLRPICKQCDNARRRGYGFSGQSVEKARASARKYQRSLRYSSDHKKIAKIINSDSKRTDRHRGWKNDLSPEWIADQIKDGCVYCGDKRTRMTMDRIDNDKPHTRDNVVPACIRCNLTRKTMPYEAWLVVAKAMRAALNAGLFGDWVGGGNHKKQVQVAAG